MVRLITDGACEGNPGPGGWAVIIVWDPQRVEEFGGGEAYTTNNRMELSAAIEGLRRVPPGEPVEITTDSQYLLKGITQWIQRWKKNGWRTTQKTEVENRDLWEALDRAAGDRVSWKWVKGHAGNAYNERADQIARGYALGGKPSSARSGLGPVAGKEPGYRSVPGSQQAEKRPHRPANAAAVPQRLGPRPPGVSYLSLVRGVLMRHSTWAECQARTSGVSGARFKKCRSLQEEKETISGWGLPPDTLPAA